MAGVQTIQDMLQGLEPAQAQTAGNMTVIPLVSDIVDNAVMGPDALELETRDYGKAAAFNVGTQYG